MISRPGEAPATCRHFGADFTSVAKTRALLQLATQRAPSIIFVDECDALADVDVIVASFDLLTLEDTQRLCPLTITPYQPCVAFRFIPGFDYHSQSRHVADAPNAPRAKTQGH
tara:strand:- start:155 stop:493 length:339 start_codon:yes stop_codon:yes gene_type:complete